MVDNFLYYQVNTGSSTIPNGIGRIDVCEPITSINDTGDEICVDSPTLDPLWALSYNPVTGMVYAANGNFTPTATSVRQRVYAFPLADFDTFLSSGNCVPPLIEMSFNTTPPNPGDNYIPAGGSLYGVIGDDNGDIYIVQARDPGATTAPFNQNHIYKYSAAGGYIAHTSWTQDTRGLPQGIAWSRATNRLFSTQVANSSGGGDCISVFDATNVNYLGQGAPFPPGGAPGGNNGKAINILTECCPSLPTGFQKTVCDAVGESFFLNRIAFDDCEVSVCGSEWTPAAGNSDLVATYDDCLNRVEITGVGCVTYNINLPATMAGCSAQNSSITICNQAGQAEAGDDNSADFCNPTGTLDLNTLRSANSDDGGSWEQVSTGGPLISGTTGVIDFTGASTGTFTYRYVFLATNNCAEDAATFTISVGTVPTATCSATDNTNCSAPNGTASVSTNASSPTYLWSNGMTTATLNNLSAGTYTVTVTDGTTGCTNTCDAVVGSTTAPPTATCSATDNTNCSTPNGTASVSTNASNPTYLWNYGMTTATLNNLSAGTYTVTVTDGTTGCTAECSATVTDPSPPVCSITVDTQPTCANPNGGSATATPTGGTAPFTYLWSDTAGQTTPTASGLAAGTYTVTLIDASQCRITCTVTLNSPTGCCPQISNPSPSQTICEGQSISSLSVNTDANSPDQIEFKYFTSQQTGSNAYTGGTSLGIVSPSAGSASITNVSFPITGICFDFTYSKFGQLPSVSGNINHSQSRSKYLPDNK